MYNMLQLKFDELRIIVKGFKDSGEDITLIHAKTRDRVHGLNGQWMGEAADKFYEDMEDKHLPSLARVAGVLFSIQDVLLRVIKLINETDLETVGYFRQDFDQFGSISGNSIGGTSQGGISTGAGGVAQSQQDAGSAGTGDTGSLDQVGGAQQGNQDTSSGSSPQDSEKEMGSGGGGAGGSPGTSRGSVSSATGSSFGSSSSRGGTSSAESSSSGSQGTPDHFYGDGESSGPTGGSGSASPGAAGSDDQGSSAGGGAVAAAAVVGVGGAALGGVAKATRGRKK